MASYNFTWDQPADEVFVTGTFDDWAKTCKLDKKDVVHEKTVALPETKDRIWYKFFVDGEWKLGPGTTEKDHEGNVNNVLYPADLKPPISAAHSISSVAPGASTLAMAGAQPTEHSTQQSTPGAFPETPAADDQRGFAVNPIPASAGISNPLQLAPGEPVPAASTINNNTVASTAHDDPTLKPTSATGSGSDSAFVVAPLPATGGVGNPVDLAPGEKVPDPATITGNTIDSNVKLDKESYEKSDAVAPILPASVNSPMEQDKAGASASGIGAQTSSMIPESSMGMGKDAPAPIDSQDSGPMMSSVAPQSTTAMLAGAVPLEPRSEPTASQSANPIISSVAPTSTTAQMAGAQPLEERSPPAIVTESQSKADVDPEASASPQALQEKDNMERELQSKVPEAPATDEAPTADSASKDGEGMAVGMGAGLLAGGAAAAYALRNKIKDTTGKDPVSVLPNSLQNRIDGAKPDESATSADAVPAVVTTSQQEARVDPEAAASPEAVQEKEAVENELMKKVPESEAKGEPAPTVTAATTATAPSTDAAHASAAPIAGGMVAGAAGTAAAGGAAALASSAAHTDSHPAAGSATTTPATATTTAPAPKTEATDKSAAPIAGGMVAGAAGAATVGAAALASSEAHTDSHRTAGAATSAPATATTTAPAAMGDATGKGAAPVAGGMVAGATGTSAAGQASTATPVSATTAPATATTTAPAAMSDKSAAPVAGGMVAGAAGAGAAGLASTAAHTNPSPAAISATSPPTATAGTSASGAPQLAIPIAGGLAPIVMDDKPAGLNAPASSQAQTSSTAAEAGQAMDSRDVSPMTKGAHTSGPSVTTGVASSGTPAESTGAAVGTPRKPAGSENTTPQKRNSVIDKLRGTPSSQKTGGSGASPESGKEKRRSLFGRIKEKLHHK